MAKIATLQDPDVNPSSWSLSGNAAITDGQLVLPCDTSYSSQALSTDTWDLTESSILVRVPQIAGLNNGTAATGFALSTHGKGDPDAMIMRVTNGSLIVTGPSGDLATVTFDASAHLWWRIRNTGTTYYFETCSDGFSWDHVIYSGARPTSQSAALYVVIYTGYASGNAPNPSSGKYDHLNVAATPGWELIGSVRGVQGIQGRQGIPGVAVSGGTLGYANILDHGAVNNADSTAAIQAAAATGLPIWVPPGFYYYTGTPLGPYASPRGYTFSMRGAGPDASVIFIGAGQYLFDNPDGNAVISVDVRDIGFDGGLGAYRDKHTGIVTWPTALHAIFSNCLFYNYTLAAVADRQLDGPYWTFNDCHFVAANNTTSTGIIMCGLKDTTNIRNCSFGNNRVHIKITIPPTGEYGGCGGNFHIHGCDFFHYNAPAEGYPQIDIWVVPGNVWTPNNGFAFDVDSCKFGNENMLGASDKRIAYADPSSWAAADNETSYPLLDQVSTGQIFGHNIRNLGWTGRGDNPGIPLVYSTTVQMSMCIIGPTAQAGDDTAPLLQFYDATGWDPSTCIVGPIIDGGAVPSTRTRVTTRYGTLSGQPKQFALV